MEEDRSTPIHMLPFFPGTQMQNQETVDDRKESKPQNEKNKQIQIEIKKKKPKGSFEIKVDFETMILLVALFLASFLNTEHLSFLPSSILGNSFAFSASKAILVFMILLLVKWQL
jgi:hypothetical protein